MRSIKFLSSSALVLGTFLSILTFANSGGWISSGGEVFKNAKNPWFVKNTTDVAYCVQFSQDEFSIPKSEVLPLIEESIQYWKSQLDGKLSVDLGGANAILPNQVRVATQSFSLNASCQGNEDLVFKFGYETLDSEELKHMKVPENFLGLTIRKDYSDKDLKGRGIIYVSGDRGKHAYKKTSKDVIEEAWKYPKLLQYVLIHELGHVFGLPHSGSGLMSEVFLDQLLIRKFAALFVREPLAPFIKPTESSEVCNDELLPTGSQSFMAPYFSLKFKVDCLKLELSEKKNEFTILTRKAAGPPDSWSQIGKLVLAGNELIDFSLKPALVLQVTEEQKVFEVLDSSFLIGPLFQNYKVDGHINFGTSKQTYSVQVDLSPDAIVVYGLYENRVRQIYSFGNPLLYSILKPF